VFDVCRDCIASYFVAAMAVRSGEGDVIVKLEEDALSSDPLSLPTRRNSLSVRGDNISPFSR